MNQTKRTKFGRHFFMRLLGIVITVPSLFLLWQILIFPNMVLRGKGLDKPYIEFDPDQLPLTIIAIFFAAVGSFIFSLGLPGRSRNQTPHQNGRPDEDHVEN